jgi:hypothetical protein
MKLERYTEMIYPLLNSRSNKMSHGGMGAFWSGTDESTAGKFGNGWMVSLVVNRKGEYKCRLDVYEPVPLVVDNIELEIAYAPVAREVKEAIEAEVKEKVSSKSYGTGFQGNGCCGGGYTGGGFHGGHFEGNRWVDDSKMHEVGNKVESELDKELEADGWVKDHRGVWSRKKTGSEVVKQVGVGNGGNGSGVSAVQDDKDDLTDEEIEMWRMGYGMS